MGFQLTQLQYDYLKGLRDNIADPDTTDSTNLDIYDPNADYSILYEVLIGYIEDWEAISGNDLDVDEERSYLWLKGALGVNEDNTDQSDFIRDYNDAQAELRFGGDVTDAQMDRISDWIGYDFISDVIDLYDNNAATDLPSIVNIARDDAFPAAQELFEGDSTPAGWAGNPLFLFLGHEDSFTNNIINSDDAAYDLLSVFKVSYETLGGFLNFLNPVMATFIHGELAYDAASTAFKADAETALLNALTASQNLLQFEYNVTLLDVGYEVLFGDVILGSEGDDSAVGGSFLEYIGFEFNELIHAGAGNDTLISGTGRDIMDGGSGNDTIDYSGSSDALVIDLQEGYSIANSVAKDYLYNIENIIGSEFNDTIHGDSNNNLLNGGGGDDIIIDGGGQDTIIGGAGVDTIQYIGGSSGTSTISGVEHVKIGNDNISGNWQEGETEGEYRKGGVTATKDGDGLVIDAGGNQIRIDDFDEDTNNYGVNLQEKDDDEPPSDDNTPSQIDEAADLFGRAQVNQFTDPLVLDLDGDGIELLNLDESSVYFDMTGDGYAEHVGWVAPDDGVLVRVAANDNEIYNTKAA